MFSLSSFTRCPQAVASELLKGSTLKSAFENLFCHRQLILSVDSYVDAAENRKASQSICINVDSAWITRWDVVYV